MANISKHFLLSDLQKNSKKKFEIINLVSLIWLITLGLVIFSVLGTLRTYAEGVPTEDKIKQALVNKGQNSKIFDRNNVLLYTFKDPDRDREYAEIEKIPSTVVAAVLGAEDKDFFIHEGIDYLGTLKGVATTVTSGGETKVGGSTVTQQLVKQTLLTNERSLDRKIQEALISMVVERDYTKKEILEYYLNTVNFGGRIQGIATASHVYFNKPVEQLSLEEAVFLIGLIQSPGEYSPLYALDKESALKLAYERRNLILEQIIANPRIIYYLNTEDEEVLKTQSESVPELKVPAKYTTNSIKVLKEKEFAFQEPVDELRAPHWVFYIRSLLAYEPYNLTLKDLYSGGYSIYTSIDIRIQELAEAKLKEGVDRYGSSFGFANGGLVTVDPRSGEILALVGSKGYNLGSADGDKKFDPKVNVTVSVQNLGSSLKPWVAYQAFESGKWKPNSTVSDSPQTFYGNYKPKNYDGKFQGDMDIRKALLDSRNLPFLKLQYQMGDWKLPDLMKRVGYRTENNYGLSAVVGGVDETLLDHTTAYSGFATGGKIVEERPVLRILKANGEVHYSSETKVIYEMDSYATKLTTNIMGDKSYTVANNRLKFIGRQKLAGKTGTSDGNKDTYYIGFGPKVLTGVWCGNNDNSRMSSRALGSSTALPIWNLYMRDLLNKFPEYGENGSY